MDNPLGCSKCRYSRKGCTRCRDPAFRERQRAKLQGKPAEPGPTTSRKRRLPAQTSGKHDTQENSAATKRTRFTRKAEKAERAPEGPPADGQKQSIVLRLGSQELRKRPCKAASAHAAPAADAGKDDLDDKPLAGEQAADAHKDIFRQPIEKDAYTRQRDETEMADVADQQIASGLELGLMAGLLPLQQSSAAAEPAVQSVEGRTLDIKELDSEPGHGTRNEESEQQQQSRPVQSTSEQSKDLSLLSTGGESMDNAQRAQRVEDSKERQRLFMEQLQRKVQQRKDHADVSSKPCLAALLTSTAKKKQKERKEVAGDPRVSVWEPPQSPFGLIEEQLFCNPWKLLVACILLNKTSVVQVRKIIWKLFELMPTPEAGMHADEEAVRELIQPLGLAPKRAPMLIRFCKDYVEKQWTDPKELHGVGQYAADAYNIFCRGDWRSVSPTDKDLLKYHKWLIETDGEGVGLLRETEPQTEQQSGSDARVESSRSMKEMGC